MKKGALDSPEALAYYYMDNFMCHEPYLKQQDCLKEYNKKWRISPSRLRLHRECLNHQDMYTACLLGINTDRVGGYVDRAQKEAATKAKEEILKNKPQPRMVEVEEV